MAKAKCDDAEFMRLYSELQSATLVARATGQTVNSALQRRQRIEARHGLKLPSYSLGPNKTWDTHAVQPNRAVVGYQITDGVIIVGSDAHIWPGPLTTMQRAFAAFAAEYKPKAVIANGDFYDGARTSRHAPIGWEHKPDVRQEIEAVKDYMGLLEKAAPSAAKLWPLGNHDMRFESKLVALNPEYVGTFGFSLKDHFTAWTPCWRADVNSDIVIRHRELGGEHADYRNVQTQGKTIVTGHDHRANVTAYNSYSGLRWGVRCGYMADSPTDPQFLNYLEAREPNWTPAFAFLTFVGGRLLWPELVTKHDDDHVQFRGQIIAV